ncbi:hypothetical protein ES705_46806 [subsurface metagenome]
MFQFFHNFTKRTVSFCIVNLYVAAGANVVIVFYNFFLAYQPGKLFFFFKCLVGFGNAFYAFSRDVVFWVAFFKLLACMKQINFVLVLLGLVQKKNNTWCCGIVKEVFGEINHTFNQVLFNKPLAAVFFFVAALVAAAPACCSGIKNNGCPSVIIQAAINVLHPAPVNLTATTSCRKAFQFVNDKVIVIDIWQTVPALVPHGIGNHTVKFFQ